MSAKVPWWPEHGFLGCIASDVCAMECRRWLLAPAVARFDSVWLPSPPIVSYFCNSSRPPGRLMMRKWR